ncbi:MAG: hypothetical protein H7062_22035 [Candidatus Saccharimonas sp.]|nr:hypothetical protein [Planctomycetaceae bacterium]
MVVQSLRGQRAAGCDVVCLAMFAALLTGCGDSSARYVPSVTQAEAAVKASLDDWKKGLPAGPVADTKPVVHVVDSQRRELPILSNYQILGEVPGNAPRCLAVRLRWANPEKEERARYVVVGIDPLWVFRQEDYDLLSHWEHPMEEPPPKDAASTDEAATSN